MQRQLKGYKAKDCPPRGQGQGTKAPAPAVLVPAHAPCVEMGSKARSGAVPFHRKMGNET